MRVPQQEPTMIDLSETVWDTEIQLATGRIDRSSLGNPDLYYQTIDLIEQGYCPQTREVLTRSALDRWLIDIQTPETREAMTNEQSHPTKRTARPASDVPDT